MQKVNITKKLLRQEKKHQSKFKILMMPDVVGQTSFEFERKACLQKLLKGEFGRNIQSNVLDTSYENKFLHH